MFSKELLQQAEALIRDCRKAPNVRLVTAESCTGGLIAALLTEVSGASEVIERGFVTYSNEAKTECLGVDAALIKKHGAVSAEVAEAMALGALQHSQAQLAVSVTGIAGPTGGTKEKPVGLVYVAVKYEDRPLQLTENHFDGDRLAIRQASVHKALGMLREVIGRG